MDDDLSPKPPSASVARSVFLTFPNDANVHGTVFGGRVMSWIDEIGALAAMRHARKPVVTVLIDAVGFCVPIRVGDFAVVEAVVTRAWTTSMEIWVKVETEDPFEDTRQNAAQAFLTFVAVDTAAMGPAGRIRAAGLSAMRPRPSAIWRPQSAVPGATPRPRNDSDERVTSANDVFSSTFVTMSGHPFGTTCTNTMRQRDSHSTCAAST